MAGIAGNKQNAMPVSCYFGLIVINVVLVVEDRSPFVAELATDIMRALVSSYVKSDIACGNYRKLENTATRPVCSKDQRVPRSPASRCSGIGGEREPTYLVAESCSSKYCIRPATSDELGLPFGETRNISRTVSKMPTS